MRLARPIGPAMYLALFELILAILSVLRFASGSCQSQFFMSSQTNLRFKGLDSAEKIQYLSVSSAANITSTIESKMAEPTPGTSSTPDLVMAAPMITDQDGGTNPVAAATFNNVDHGLIVQAGYGQGLPEWATEPSSLASFKRWYKNNEEVEFPFALIWARIFKSKISMAHHSKEELVIYRDIKQRRKQILLQEERLHENLAEVVAISDEIAEVDKQLLQLEAGVVEEMKGSLHARFRMAYPQHYDSKMAYLFVNYELLLKQREDPRWVQNHVNENNGNYRDSAGIARRLLFDCKDTYLRYLVDLTGKEPLAADLAVEPNACDPSLLYTFDSSACSKWPKKECSLWADGQPHFYPECFGCGCRACRMQCIRERHERSDDDHDWPDLPSPREPTLEQARGCCCTLCTKMVLREDYEHSNNTVLSATTTSAESEDAMMTYENEGASQPTRPPIPDPATITPGANQTAVLYSEISFPDGGAASTIPTQPLNPAEDRTGDIRADVRRIFEDVDWVHHFYNLACDPIGSLINAARTSTTNNETRRYPALFERLVEAAQENGARRADDEEADHVGIRDTLFGLVLNHAHHARDRRWSDTGADSGACAMCQNASIFEPHIQHGGPFDRDPSQVLQAGTNETEEDVAIRARMEQIRQRRADAAVASEIAADARPFAQLALDYSMVTAAGEADSFNNNEDEEDDDDSTEDDEPVFAPSI